MGVELLVDGLADDQEINLKRLRLIKPEYLREQGLETDEPLLISPWDDSLLIYQQGSIVSPTDFSRKGGGVGYDNKPARVIRGETGYAYDVARWNWVAIVEPIGKSYKNDSITVYSINAKTGKVSRKKIRDPEIAVFNRRAERVRVKSIHAFCQGCREGPLDKGAILDYDRITGWIWPVCSLEKHSGHIAEGLHTYNFEIGEGGKVLITDAD